MAAARSRRQPGQPLAAGRGVRSPYSASGVVLRHMAFEDEAHSAVAGDTLSLAQARVLVARVLATKPGARSVKGQGAYDRH